MRNILFLILCLTACYGCTQNVQLNRVQGIRGPLAPVVLDGFVLFAVSAPDASLVTLSGNFNGWDSQITPMKKDSTGIWSVKLPLTKGRKYYYKFVIDGFFLADPDNPDTVPDGFSGVNSVINVK